MNRQKKSITLLASAMAVILATPTGVYADGGQGGGWNRSGHYNNHYNTYYKGGPHYYPYYNGYNGCNNCGKGHHHNNNNNNDKLWIGLLGGGILGYTLGNVLQHNANSQTYYPEPAPAPAPTVNRYETSYANNSCLQEREYRSKIMVGGKQVEGYGTACLQPDGSWRYGPAQPESY
jgi:hypothetical protein